jgi:hypothetical protein
VSELPDALRRSVGVAAILFAIYHVFVWRRVNFWLPPLAHWLAALGFLVGMWLVWLDYSSGESLGWKQLSSVMVLPILVYLAFVFYGGVTDAVKRGKHAKAKDRDPAA